MSIFVSDHYGTALLDGDTLEQMANCKKERAIIHLARTTRPEYQAALVEFHKKILWIDTEGCSIRSLPIQTASPFQVLCSDRLSKCYVSGWWSSATLSEIALDKDGFPSRSRGLLIGPYSLGMAMDGTHEHLMVVRPLAGCVDVIDTTTFRRVRRIPIPPMVRAIAYSSEMDMLFVPEYSFGKVHLVRFSTGEELGSFRVGRFIRAITWNSELQSLFLVDQNLVYRITKDDLDKLVGR